MQNAQLALLKAIEGLIEESQIQEAVDALLDLDQQTGAGIRQDVILTVGNWQSASRAFRQNLIAFDEFSRHEAKARFGLLELMKELPKRVDSNAQFRNLNTFQFGIPDPVKLEKIIGPQNNLLKISWLERALQASRAVCRVVCASGELGTGFITKDGYLFTNNHVIPSKDVAQSARIEFNYELDATGTIKSRTAYMLDASDFITSTPEQLDFCRVKILDRADKPLSQWGYVEFDAEALPTLGEPVTIIQHPKGQDKQIALTANEVLGQWQQHLYYATDTEPGSSGSPVFNKDWKVVAIHHAGLTEAEGGMQINARGDRKAANRGILFRDIFAFLGGQKTPAVTPVMTAPEVRESTVPTPPTPVPSAPTPTANPAPVAPAPAPVTGPPKFMILYDEADKEVATRFSKHLNLLRISKKLRLYNVHDAAIGEDPLERAQGELADTDYVIVLLTINLYGSEAWLGLLFELIEQGRRILPIRVDQSPIDGTGLERLKSLPAQNRSVADYGNPDTAWAEIVTELKKLLPK